MNKFKIIANKMKQRGFKPLPEKVTSNNEFEGMLREARLVKNPCSKSSTKEDVKR